MLIVRWMTVADAECLRDDGVRNYWVEDFIALPEVLVLRDKKSVVKAKKLIEQEISKISDGEYSKDSLEWGAPSADTIELFHKTEHVATMVITEVSAI